MPEAFGGSEKISGAMFSVEISANCILGLFCGRLGEFVAHSHGAERYHSREDDDDDQEDSFKASVDHDRLGFARHELAPGNPLREGRIGTAASICINASDRPLRS
jgi:hypothetical protein